jgi:uncharacterized protein (TIGR03435 family)
MRPLSSPNLKTALFSQQTKTPPTEAPPQPATDGSAQPAADPTLGIVFDVVSIRLNKDGKGSYLIDPPDGDGITITNLTLFDIVRWNYNIRSYREDQLQGVPDWFKTDRYDIQAKVAEADVATWRKLYEGGHRLVFRKLLADRFKFAFHWGAVEQPIYNLVVAKGGPRMREVQPGDPNPDAPKGRDGTPLKGSGIFLVGPNKLVCQEIHMLTFTKGTLSRATGRQVFDKTGLTGMYDFNLEFAQDARGAGPDSPNPPDSSAPSIFTALQEQLGLKLESAKGPVDQLVLDHIERPSEE